MQLHLHSRALEKVQEDKVMMELTDEQKKWMERQRLKPAPKLWAGALGRTCQQCRHSQKQGRSRLCSNYAEPLKNGVSKTPHGWLEVKDSNCCSTWEGKA